MTIKIEAATRLVVANAPNKLKNEIMRALVSHDLHVTRSSNDRLLADATLVDVIKALQSIGWEYTRAYRELTKTGEEYSIALTPDGHFTALDFLYSA